MPKKKHMNFIFFIIFFLYAIINMCAQEDRLVFFSFVSNVLVFKTELTHLMNTERFFFIYFYFPLTHHT